MINTALSPIFIFFLFVVIGLWLISISFIVFRMVRHYNRLVGGSVSKSLREVLENLLINQKHITDRIKEAENGLNKLRDDGKFHISRVGIVRFNPFEDTGGAQSFTLAILDGNNTGIIMTSLYARSNNRWYVKEVINGKGKELELSKEENLAIHKALDTT